MIHDVVIVGAGVSGLACARELRNRGVVPVVLNSGKSVGGRCSTWRAGSGQAIDYGVTFLHGTTAEFLGAIREVPGRVVEWPVMVEGNGTPCQPHAFEPSAFRYAVAEGIQSFPKYLARDIDVTTSVEVIGIGESDGVFHLSCSPNEGPDYEMAAKTVVLAIESSRTLTLIDTLPRSIEILAARKLLTMMSSIPSLTLMCTYGNDTSMPVWDMMYPGVSSPLKAISNEGKKRPDTGGALVFQAKSSWSSHHISDPVERWSAQLLSSAAETIGDRVLEPVWSRPHIWEHARTESGAQLSSPMLIDIDGARIGLCGEAFAREVGIEGAYLSGISMARRIAGDTE